MELRPYQLEDVEFLKQHKVAGIFNEQRTGKTPTTLVALKEHGAKKILIVCPASALLQWKEEFEKWLGRQCLVVTGTPKQKQQIIDQWTDGLVISYDSLRVTKTAKGCINEIIQAKTDAVILDEVHRIKNFSSATAKSAFKLKNTPIKYAFSGTPAPNKSHEIWAILHWLYPTEFKSYWSFIGEYYKTTLQHIGGHTYKEVGEFKPEMYDNLNKRLQEFTIQRKRVDVMPWLPKKDRNRIRFKASKEQEKYLKELKEYFETGSVITQGVLDTLTRYRQICLHPGLVDLPGRSPKFDWLQEYVKDYPDTPTIIFSKFSSFIKLIATDLKHEKFGVIIGDTPIEERNRLKHAFQTGKLNLLIINIDAGKEALTLDRAECTIFTDKYPPVSDILQAEDRFVSTTIDKADKPHKIIELVIKDTYDEELVSMISANLAEVDVINNYKKYIKK